MTLALSGGFGALHINEGQKTDLRTHVKVCGDGTCIWSGCSPWVGVEVARTWFCPSVVSFTHTHPQRVSVIIEVLTAVLL